MNNKNTVYDAFSESLRSHKSLWELLHQYDYFSEIKEIFDAYDEEEKLFDVILSLSVENPLAWNHATGISSLVYLTARELKCSIIEAQEAFLASLLKFLGLTNAFPSRLTGEHFDQPPVLFEYPDLIYRKSEQNAYLNWVKEGLYNVPGLSINIIKFLELSFDQTMVNELESKEFKYSTIQKLLIACNDLYSHFLILPKKLQTVAGLINIANSHSLYRFPTIYRTIVSLFRTLPEYSEKFPPGPAELESRLSKVEEYRGQLVTNVRKMLSIVADLKAEKIKGIDNVIHRIPYRLWLITNSSGILSAYSVTGLWKEFDVLTGVTSAPKDFDRMNAAFSISKSLNDIELIQWYVNQQISAHAYALHGDFLKYYESISDKHLDLSKKINAYLEFYDLSVTPDDVQEPRAPTLVESNDANDEGSDDFNLFNIG